MTRSRCERFEVALDRLLVRYEDVPLLERIGIMRERLLPLELDLDEETRRKEAQSYGEQLLMKQ